MIKEKKAKFEPTRVEDQLESNPTRVGIFFFLSFYIAKTAAATLTF